jgi:hypothetical protein
MQEDDMQINMHEAKSKLSALAEKAWKGVHIPEQTGHRFRCKVDHPFRSKLVQAFRCNVGH